MAQKISSQGSVFEVVDPAQSPDTFVNVGNFRGATGVRSGYAYRDRRDGPAVSGQGIPFGTEGQRLDAGQHPVRSAGPRPDHP